MNENKLLNGFSYISILFAPFLFPFIVWLLTAKDSDAHYHARRAFILHLIPSILIVFMFIVIMASGYVVPDVFFELEATTIGTLVFLGIIIIFDSIMLIYNVYYGIKQFLQ